MAKLCLNSRDELIIVDIDKVAFLQANGNYTHIVYLEGLKMMISLGLSKIEEMLKAAFPKNKPSPFVRIGRSLIINQTYLCQIHVLKQQLILSDFGKHHYTLSVPKQLLKSYRELIKHKYTPKTDTEQ